METLKLSDDVRSSMRSFYEEELEKLLRRLEHIEVVLTQLGGSSKSQGDSPAKRRGRPKSVATSTPKAAKPAKRGRKSGKRGPKPRWEGLILDRMAKMNRPVTYEELTEDIMTATKTDPSRKQQLKQSVLNVTFRLRQRDKAIRTVSSGTRVKYLALSKWFDDKGNIKTEYKKLIKPVAVKARKTKKAAVAKTKIARVGRPAKKVRKVVAKPVVKKAAKKSATKASKPTAKPVKKVAKKDVKKPVAKTQKPVAKSVKPAKAIKPTKVVKKAAKKAVKKVAVKAAAPVQAKKTSKGGIKPALKVKGAAPKVENKTAPVSKKSPASKTSGASISTGKKSSRNSIPNAPNWTEYVQSFISKAGKPVLANSILTTSMSELKIDKAYKPKVRTAIARCMSQLEKSGNKLRRVNPTGPKPHSYGLGSWFDANGAIKPEFSGK